MSEGARTFLFLQGPPGPLFFGLSRYLGRRGVTVHRINLNLGDRLDWAAPATNYRSRFSFWPVFVDAFMRRHQVTDVLLFGDCRPYHVVAHRIARLRNIRVHVLEEGYLRPHWMTLELEGVNAHSRLRRDKDWFLAKAAQLPPEPDLPPVTASFRRRIRDTLRYYTAVQVGRLAYPFYKTHRMSLPILEGFGWLWKFARKRSLEDKAAQTIERLRDRPFFLLPLQLSGDFQIRSHSPFPDMPAATAYVLASFAANAPADAQLLIKAHPLDASFFSWRRFIGRLARKYGVGERVHYVDGGDLDKLAAQTEGMICVNSTSATLALRRGRPVSVLGEAIYKVPGLVFEGHLDRFWTNPTPPLPGVYEAFRRVLLQECLVRGGLASKSAVKLLLRTMTIKLLGDDNQRVVSQASTEAKCSPQVGAL